MIAFRDSQDNDQILWHIRIALLITASLALFLGVFADGFTYDFRLRAWLDSPNLLALFLFPGALLWWVRILVQPRITWIDWFGWIITTLTVLLTRSYGVCVAYGVSGLFFVWIEREYLIVKRAKWVLIGSVFVLSTLFIGIESTTGKWAELISGNNRSSLASRAMIWTAAARMLHDHPLVGIGPGRFQEVYLEYQHFYPPYLEWAVPHPHNFIIAIWLSAGIFGFGSYVWLLIRIATYARIIPLNRERARALTLFVAFLIVGLTDVPYFRAELCFMFWFILAMVADSFSAER